MTERLLILSADGHIGAQPKDYRPYLEPAFRGAMDDLLAEDAHWNELTRFEELAKDPEFCGWNIANRIKALDAEGVVAELMHPGVQGAALPFFSCANLPCSVDLQWAGARAYNRWLADAMAGAEGRLLGVGALGPCYDMDAVCAELRWLAEHGFVSVELPQSTYEKALPPLRDAHYEPIWAECEALGLRLALHAGWGVAQGDFWTYSAKFLEITGQSKEAFLERASEEMLANLASVEGQMDEAGVQVLMAPRRALWQMMVSGAFDRHPDLIVVTTELRADWVPGTLAALDARFRESDRPMKRLPSEYWASNCYITPSSIRDSEIALRHEIGVDRVMFGTDAPHPEATWPDSRAWMRHAFRGMPEAEARAILGGNAIRCYGLDPAPYEALAARIGPTVEEVLGAGEIDADLLDAFDKRAGLRLPAERVDAGVVRRLLEEDLAAVGA